MSSEDFLASGQLKRRLVRVSEIREVDSSIAEVYGCPGGQHNRRAQHQHRQRLSNWSCQSNKNKSREIAALQAELFGITLVSIQSQISEEIEKERSGRNLLSRTCHETYSLAKQVTVYKHLIDVKTEIQKLGQIHTSSFFLERDQNIDLCDTNFSFTYSDLAPFYKQTNKKQTQKQPWVFRDIYASAPSNFKVFLLHFMLNYISFFQSFSRVGGR